MPQRPSRFQRKLANLAAVIDQQQPDVLALQEIGPDGALQALQGPSAPRCPYASSGIADGRGFGWPSSPAMRLHSSGTSSPSPR